MNHAKETYLRKMVKEVCDYLLIDSPLVLPDSRIMSPMMAFVPKFKRYVIKYNPNGIKYEDKTRIKLVAFHEVGHMFYYCTQSDTEEEYLAEKFAHKYIYKFYPNEFWKAQLYTMNDYECTNKSHAQAYYRILKEEGFFGYDD